MKGHINVRHGKRGDSWFYKIPLGRNPMTGKKKDEKRRGFATRAEAKAVMDLRISALMQERAMKRIQSFLPMMPGLVAPASPTPPSPLNPMTVAELLHKWLDDSIAITGKGNTPDNYRRIVEGVIIPVFGHLYLHELQHDHIQEWIKTLQTPDSTGKTLSASSIRNYFTRFKTALYYAKNKLKLIPENPATGIDLPPVKKKKHIAVSPDHVREILDALLGTRWYMPAFIGFYTGLRIGELTALPWTCIDFDACTLEVRYGLVRKKGEGLVLDTPKTESSNRTIAISKASVKVLREHQERQKEEFALLGKRWTMDSPVIVNTVGKYMDMGHLSEAFGEAAEQLGYKLTFHDTRHAHATILLKAGQSMKVVSERLGHSSIVITMDLYAHVLEGMDKDAAEAFGDEIDLPRLL